MSAKYKFKKFLNLFHIYRMILSFTGNRVTAFRALGDTKKETVNIGIGMQLYNFIKKFYVCTYTNIYIHLYIHTNTHTYTFM